MTNATHHRLNGLEPDNLLAFLALLGTLRAIEQARPALLPRASWSLDMPPTRACLHVAEPVDRETLAGVVADGVAALAAEHDFAGRADLNFNLPDCQHLLQSAAQDADRHERRRADLLSALMSDAALKPAKDGGIDPTPLCLLFGQGHQHFLERLAAVPQRPAPPVRGRGQTAVQPTPAETIAEALFSPWLRQDPTRSFRWDFGEDVRYATMGGDPTDPAFKSGTQHGANRLAAVGLPVLQVAARTRAGGVRAAVTGGRRDAEGFMLAWPIWSLPARLSGITALLRHPQLHTPRALGHLGVAEVRVARRISVGKFMNFTRARPLS